MLSIEFGGDERGNEDELANEEEGEEEAFLASIAGGVAFCLVARGRSSHCSILSYSGSCI